MFFFFQAEDGIRDIGVTGVQTCALPIWMVAVGIAPGKTTAPVEITRLVRRSQRIIGSYGARTRADMPEILSLSARGFFDPKQMVTQKLSLEEVDSAYRALDRGEIVGRAVVVP